MKFQDVIKRTKRKEFLLCVLIFFIVGITFFPALSNSFTNFDDKVYLTENPLIRSLTPLNIKRIFTTIPPHTIYVPMVTLTFALEYRLWKLDPRGYHGVNLLLHIFNALLVFFLIRSIFYSQTVAFFTSLLFAIHPLRVESVAWVTERKDLLFTFFFLLAIHLYIRYLKKDSSRNYLLTLLMFVFAILSKASALILPIVLLSLDWLIETKISKKRWLEKIPIAIILFFYGIISWYTLKVLSPQNTNPHYLIRVKNSLWAVPFYLQKTILPFRLSAHYPTDMRFFMPSLWFSYCFTIILFGGSFLLLKKFRREWLWGWGFFFIALLQIFGVLWYLFPVANRYSYLPSIGLSFILVMIVFLISKQLVRWKKIKLLWIVINISVLLFLGTSSFLRCRVWKDSISLWNDVIWKYPMIPLAYNNRGNALKSLGRIDEALADYSQAIQLRPHSSFFWNRGLLQLEKKQLEKAEEDFYSAICQDIEYFQQYDQIMVYTHGQSGYEQIIDMGKRILAVQPNSQIHIKLAEIFIRLRRWQETDFHLQEAVRLSPQTKEYQRTLEMFRKTLNLNPRGFDKK